MRTLSIMIDETGNFNMEHYSSPYYCMTMVFHNQNDDITENIELFDNLLLQSGFSVEKAIHTNPLIRKEAPYQDMERRNRKKLFAYATAFTSHLPISYKTLTFNKTETDTYGSLLTKMLFAIKNFITENLAFFQSFDKQILYYDRGQKEISNLLRDSFSEMFPTTLEVRLAFQNDYKLLQVADLIGTLEFTRLKFDTNQLTKADLNFFESRRYFIQNYYKKISRKQL